MSGSPIEIKGSAGTSETWSFPRSETVISQDFLSDEEVVARVLAGETSMFEIVMRRYNQRLYRVARSVLRNDGEAEDVMQDAYVCAYEHLGQFAGRAKFSTWLSTEPSSATKIADT